MFMHGSGTNTGTALHDTVITGGHPFYKSDMTLNLEEIEELVLRRKWLLSELKRFEEKYGMDSEEFIRSWREGLIPEPDDPEVHGDFMVWEALVEELVTVESKLRSLGRNNLEA